MQQKPGRRTRALLYDCLTVTGTKLYKLRRWTLRDQAGVRLFTSARPGRKYSKDAPVSDDEVRMWTDGIHMLGPNPTVVSLLGRKPDGMSEYGFYSFYGGLDDGQDHPGRLSFAEWLTSVDPFVELIEHPTIDFEPITPGTLQAIEADVRGSLRSGRTVLVFDSGGETRTGQVCRHLGASEAFPTLL